MSENVVLEMRAISKSFPGVQALDNVNFQLQKGSVHALLGENGAGKSTLMKILSGVYQADSGEILLGGEPVSFADTCQSQQRGIAIIHQELNLCWNLSVAENILLNREIVGLGTLIGRRVWSFCQRGQMNRQAEQILARLGVNQLGAQQVVGDLSIAQQQMVEIAKAISIQADILIMDEPTSSLSEKEENMLFAIIKALQSQGVSIIYISHKLEEIFRICDCVTVIRDGVGIASLPIAQASRDSLIELMVGRSIDMTYPPQDASDSQREKKVLFAVQNLRKDGLVDDVSFQIREGEILGISGLVGAGRTEMAKTLFGRWQKDGGTIYLGGREIRIASTADAIRCGLAFVSEDRKKEGLNLVAEVVDNIMSSNLDLVSGFMGLVNVRKEQAIAQEGVQKLRVKTPSIHTAVKNLSGGNQQKLIISRWLAKKVKVFILDEPTRGIDVGAKAEIYQLMRAMAAEGIAIVMISSELPEILGMSDRIAVMRCGQIVQILSKDEASQEKIIHYATGGK